MKKAYMNVTHSTLADTSKFALNISCWIEDTSDSKIMHYLMHDIEKEYHNDKTLGFKECISTSE